MFLCCMLGRKGAQNNLRCQEGGTCINTIEKMPALNFQEIVTLSFFRVSYYLLLRARGDKL